MGIIIPMRRRRFIEQKHWAGVFVVNYIKKVLIISHLCGSWNVDIDVIPR